MSWYYYSSLKRWELIRSHKSQEKESGSFNKHWEHCLLKPVLGYCVSIDILDN